MSYRLRVRAARALISIGRFGAWRRLVGALQIVFGAGYRRALKLAPLKDLQQLAGEPGGWEAVSDDPQLQSRDIYPLIPKGWCRFEARIRAPEGARAALYLDTGRGFDPHHLIDVEIDPVEGVSALIQVPASTRALRFDPVDRPTTFRLGPVTLTQVSLPMQLGRHAAAGGRRVRELLAGLGRGLRGLADRMLVRPASAIWRFASSLVLALTRRGGATHSLSLEPEDQITRLSSSPPRWHSLGADPRFRVEARRLPRGWCDLSTRLDGPGLEPVLVARLRGDREAELTISGWHSEGGRVSARVYVPPSASQLWWRPLRGTGEFEQAPSLELRTLGFFDQLRRPTPAAEVRRD